MAQPEASLTRQDSAQLINRRLYNTLTFGLVTISFGITWFIYNFATTEGTLFGLSPITALIVYLVGTFGGIILMSMGKKRQSVALSLLGYIIFSLTFGGTLAILLTRYSVGTIRYAFAVTACISGIFLIAGVVFPNFFARIGGVLCIGLLGLIIAEFVAVFIFHASQTIFDYIGILLFGGCLGYYAYRMNADDPTVPNAIFYAADIYMAIVNILIRVLNISDRR